MDELLGFGNRLNTKLDYRSFNPKAKKSYVLFISGFLQPKLI